MEFDRSVIIAIIAVAAVVVIAALAWWLVAMRRRRTHTAALRDHFGPEYDAVVERSGRRRGETQLRVRMEQADQLDLTRLGPSERDDYTEQWRTIQYRFVDTPIVAVREAEHLVVEVMGERNLPMDDIESRAAALSMTIGGELTPDYRSAVETLRDAEAGNEDIARLRQAMLDLRSTFEALLDRPEREPTTARTGANA